MRNPARLGKRDSNHQAIAEALRAIGCPVMDLSHAGNGVEDLLVGVSVRRALANSEQRRIWLPIECKVPPIRYEKSQLEWRARTSEWPRLTVASAQQAVDEVRRMGG